ncbi:metalloendoproteinase 2-MMP-like [Salvia splendens]|uniref:metalloendoproteinase 2-MMP-like n=1 Tax=Salvia splendens TaxID=180675 RepID=UPI001C2780CC|nr:metalloendoproteinase 2-MMP-like [Salvia splendens]
MCVNSYSFFPNISSIPASFIAKASSWDAFSALHGCRRGMKSQGLASLKKYFQLFGYINTSSDEFDEFLESTLKNFQLNFNLNQTGELDAPTLKQIFLPCYGNADIVNDTSTMHSGKSSNTYNVKQSTRPALLLLPQLPVLAAGEKPDHLRVRAVESTLRFGERHLQEGVRAVVGGDVLTFVETTTVNCADLRIRFFSCDHGDE